MVRSEYQRGDLRREDLNPNPAEMLSSWIADARSANVVEPTAMCVSTVGQFNLPSSRMVLLQLLDDNGLVFYTNTHSRKGQELKVNSHACTNFWWGQLERQVRVEGKIEHVSEIEADAYFSGRPRLSQIAAHASPQSQVIASRKELESRMGRFEELYPDNVPRPAHWGGFRIVPACFEFWQGRRARTHDRFRYRLENGLWIIEQLAP